MKQYIIINEETGEAREVYTCDGCGCIIEDIEDVGELGDYHLCPDCEGEYEICEDCGELVAYDDIIVVNEGHWRNERQVCESCIGRGDGTKYFRCSRCGEWHTRTRLWAEDQYCSICYDCEDEYRVCADCGKIVPYEAAYEDEDDWNWYCHDCYQRRGRGSIHDYDYKPDPVFGTKNLLPCKSDYYVGNDLTIGVELEIDCGNHRGKVAGEIIDLTDMVYLKSDGSLTRGGIEIVSHPCTLEYHRDCMPWEEIMRVALDNDYKSHDAGTCGLHFHVGLDQLLDDENGNFVPDPVVAKLIVLVRRLSPFVELISRRNGRNRYCKPNPVPTFCDSPNANIGGYLSRVYRESMNFGRYAQVNIQNDATVEFRFFRGTLKYSSFMAAMQFVVNLCQYAKTHSLREILKATPDAVVNYTKYPELTAYVEDRLSRQSRPIDDLVACVSREASYVPLVQGRFVRYHHTLGEQTLRDGVIGLLMSDGAGCHGVYDCVWYDYNDGHTLDDELTGDLRRSGWRVTGENLEAIPANEVPVAFVEQLCDRDNFTPYSRYDSLIQAIQTVNFNN